MHFLQQFWQSPFNVVDLVLTLFCALTLLVLVFASCGAGSKEEEIFDTLLLVARNVLQFGRLASVMRQYVISVPSNLSSSHVSYPQIWPVYILPTQAY